MDMVIVSLCALIGFWTDEEAGACIGLLIGCFFAIVLEILAYRKENGKD